MQKGVNIDERLQKMKNIYYKIDEFIDKMPNTIPPQVKDLIKNSILGDKELKSLIDGIEKNRPPKIFMIGRTGFGKSSLINALCCAYVADVGDVRSCTEGTTIYECSDNGRTLMEILDTRGIAESESLSNDTAEKALLDEVVKFSPDVAILVLNCTHRDDVDKDVLFVKRIAENYKKINGVELPIVVAVNKCDEMAPSRFKEVSEYPESKIRKIEEAVEYFKGIIDNNGLKIEEIIAVSSLIDWMTENGEEIDPEKIKELDKKEVENLKIAFDGRYHVEELRHILEEAILDTAAQMGLRMAFRLEELVKRISKKITDIFSSISATVALSPIPVSDIYILVTLQGVLVTLIASLSGRDISLEAAIEFIFSMGGVAAVGQAFKILAQQSSKLLNAVFPGAGSAVSSGIAFAGTKSIGEAAIAYYVEGKDLNAIKKKMKKNKK